MPLPLKFAWSLQKSELLHYQTVMLKNKKQKPVEYFPLHLYPSLGEGDPSCIAGETPTVDLSHDTVLITHVFSLSSSFLNTCFIPPRNVMFSPHSHCTELVWPRRVLCVHSRKDFKVKPIYFVRATESVTLLYAPTIVF